MFGGGGGRGDRLFKRWDKLPGGNGGHKLESRADKSISN